MKYKLSLSFLFMCVFLLFSATVGRIYEIAKTPLVGSLSTNQLNDSTKDYVLSNWGIETIKYFNPTSLAFYVLIFSIIMLWKKDIKKLFNIFALMAALGTAIPFPAQAYYQKTDWAEVQEILPNQTAFLIPETGANKTDQAAFGSESYLNDKKVAMKRVTIPHVKLEDSGLFANYYVPGSRLLIVDRTPVTREWVTAAERGTTTKDEGFRFESKESINIETGIVISAFVKEEDAAKFVYWFGAKQQTIAAGDNEAQFASIIYARSLAEVVDDNVRRKVQATLAREFGKRGLIEAAAQKADIIETVQKEVKETFAPMGITIAFVGYAEGLSYDKDIQTAINSVFLATKKAEANTQLMAAIPYEQAIVNINFINAEADAIRTAAGKWQGAVQLPSWVVLPEGVSDAFQGWFGKPKVAPSIQPTK